MKPLKFILQTHVHQHGMVSSGLACLTSVAKYHDGEIREDLLEHLSGTTLLGTTVLGLYQAAGKVGFDVEGLKYTVEDLKCIDHPVILDVTMDGKLKHFVVCYGFDGQFLIGDPAWGLMQYSDEELLAVWKSKTLIRLMPNADFLKKEIKIRQKGKWRLELIKGDMHMLFVVAVLDLAICFVGLVCVVLIQRMTDILLLLQNKHNLFLAFLSLGVAAATWTFMVHVKDIVTAIQTREFMKRLSASCDNKLITLSRSLFESLPAEKFSVYGNDLSSIEASGGFIFRNLLIHPVIVVISIGFVFSCSLLIGLMVLAGVGVYGLVGMRNLNGLANLQQECSALVNQNQNNYANDRPLLSLIKQFNKEDMFSKIAADARDRLQQSSYRLEILTSQKKARLNFVQIALVAPTLLTTSFMVFDHKLTVGEMVAVVILVLSAFSSAKMLLMSTLQFYKANAVLNRMFEFLCLKGESVNKDVGEKSSQNSHDFNLTVRDVAFRYNGNRQLFKNISFFVKRGELVTIFGCGGCGKSTVVKILERIVSVESGQISFNGKDWGEVEVSRWRQAVAVVPQHVKMINRTLIENLCFETPSEVAAHVIQFCRTYHFDKYFESLPQGYLTPVGEDGINLSGSHRQLVGLARALLKQPKLLLLDDVTNLMDRKTEAFTRNLLSSLKQEIAIILVTNRLSMPEADRIYLLEDGEMRIQGTHAALIQFNNCYSESFAEKVSSYEIQEQPQKRDVV